MEEVQALEGKQTQQNIQIKDHQLTLRGQKKITHVHHDRVNMYRRPVGHWTSPDSITYLQLTRR